MSAIATTESATVEAVINYVDPASPIGAINDIEREKSTLNLIPHRMRIRDARPLRDRLGLETKLCAHRGHHLHRRIWARNPLRKLSAGPAAGLAGSRATAQ